ncbi:MAG: ATP-binding protein [Acidimicrobiaceae bacterium]|nr:ATP-binding protein [Acidimicrobiaceae bacterium]
MVSRYPRIVEHLIEKELLPAFPALLIVGARGSGKSTSAAQFADTIIDLSMPGPRKAAQEDPDGILTASTGTVVIDEWQEAPEIIGAVKRAVDTDTARTQGRFILTGSVRAAQKAPTWPGTGRLIRIRMSGLTQSEIEHNNTYNPIDAFFAVNSSTTNPSALTAPDTTVSDLNRVDYLQRITAGRFPYAFNLSDRNRSRWFDAYVEQLVELDAPQIAGVNPRPRKLRAVLESCAARTGQELNKQATARDAGVTSVTADTHLRLLEDLSIVIRIPAWHTKRLYRLTRSPKVHVIDPGLAAHLLQTNVQEMTRDATLVGQLIETFVATELLPHLETTSDRTGMFHFRDRSGHEVDFILERRNWIVGLEVKSSTDVNRRDAKNLIWLKNQLGNRFHLGVLLYTGKFPFKIDNKLWALPISTLWHQPNIPHTTSR